MEHFRFEELVGNYIDLTRYFEGDSSPKHADV
jgi:hypothetical protein